MSAAPRRSRGASPSSGGNFATSLASRFASARRDVKDATARVAAAVVDVNARVSAAAHAAAQDAHARASAHLAGGAARSPSPSPLHALEPRMQTSTSSSHLPPPAAAATPNQRCERLAELTSRATVPTGELASLLLNEGVPDGHPTSLALRSLAWKLLLGYLPAERDGWAAHLRRQREIHRAWRVEFDAVVGAPGSPDAPGERSVAPSSLDPPSPAGTPADAPSESPVAPASLEPSSPAGTPAETTPAAAAAATAAATAPPNHPSHPMDQPLAPASTSALADEELRREIRKDVDRTLPDYAFFAREDPRGCIHHTALSNILFLYAKLNPGIRYVQGMNELLAPIYYVFCSELEGAEAAAAQAPVSATTGGGAAASETPGTVAVSSIALVGLDAADAASWEAVEADTFFCFTNLMAEVRDHFCSKLDHTELGITAKISELEVLLKQTDPELAAMLERLRVSPTFYGFRWITLLMTQEFDLPDVLRLWDSLLADSRRFTFLNYFCATMVLSIRDELLQANDFAYTIKALQSYGNAVPLETLLARALRLYERGRGPA